MPKKKLKPSPQNRGKVWHKAKPKKARTASKKVYVYGTHVLKEALVSRPECLRKVYLADSVRDQELHKMLEEKRIPVSALSTNAAQTLVGRDAVHQGAIAVIDPDALLQEFAPFVRSLDLGKQPALALLGEIQDPHNVGAIIRSAAALGISGVLLPEHNQAHITGAVVKTSAGMAFRMPLVAVRNVNTALATLKDQGFWVYGLDAEGPVSLEAEAFDAPTVFVIGNEGRGIREKTRTACDTLLSIPMHERTESLNAAVSAAITFYAWSARHPEAVGRAAA